MKTLIKLLSIILAILFTVPVIAQEESQESIDFLEKTVDQLTYDWDKESKDLKTYGGLGYICRDKTYRKKIFMLLNDIHHQDTVLIAALTKINQEIRDPEIKKTLKEIEVFETKYNSQEFISFLRTECKAQKKIEKESDETRNEVGETSYSGQAYILETEVNKYISHVTTKVDRLRTHLHHISEHYKKIKSKGH